MSSRGVLAIDFGTANTYFCKCPEDERLPKGVDFGGGRDGLDSCILYREGKDPLIGETAFQEFGCATAEERRRYTFRAQFKPDIVTSAVAREDATAFLKAVLESSRRKNIDIEPADRRVIFGVPAEADRSFRETLAEIARSAGYGIIETREEPLGGLFYHVAEKTIPPSDALRGVLVIDFGGGTCDLTFTYRGKIQKPWGDMHLGGRVFDDLFFQWLMEQNPAVAEALDQGDAFFLYSHLCRELKEKFSRKMNDDRDSNFSHTVDRFGRLSKATWKEFIERARTYRPSSVFSAHLHAIGSSSPLLDRDQPTDLIDWFEACLTKGFEDGKVDRRDIATVILTGGSSQWPFVSDMVEEKLFIDRNRIRRSDRPYAAISEGLAIEPVLQRQLEQTRRKLVEDLPRFQRECINKLVANHIERTADEIADAITSELFDGQIKQTLRKFRENGGKIVDLKSEIASHATAFAPRVQSIVTSATDRIAMGLPQLVLDEMRKWFEVHGLEIGRDMLEFSGNRVATPDLDSFNLPDLLAGFKQTIRAVAGGVVGVLTAQVCGGAGTAVIATGPIGWIIGLVLGAAVAYAAATVGMEAANSRAETIHLYALLLRIPMRDSQIDVARRSLHSQTREEVLEELNKLRTVLNERLEGVVSREISALSELHEM